MAEIQDMQLANIFMGSNLIGFSTSEGYLIVMKNVFHMELHRVGSCFISHLSHITLRQQSPYFDHALLCSVALISRTCI